MTGSQRERRKEEKTERMKMKLRETDKTRMLKGFQSVGCLGSSLKPYAKAISIEPLLGKSSQTTAAISNIVSVKQPSQANPTVPIKPQVLIAVSGWCRFSQPVSVHSRKKVGPVSPSSSGKPKTVNSAALLDWKGLCSMITKAQHEI